VAKIQVPLKSDNNNGYFTRRPVDNFDHISLISSQNEKCFRQNCGGNQNTRFGFSNFFFFFENHFVYEKTWKISCLIPKATHTHTHTHTLRICNTHCFSTATAVAHTRLTVTLHVHCLSCFTGPVFVQYVSSN